MVAVVRNLGHSYRSRDVQLLLIEKPLDNITVANLQNSIATDIVVNLIVCIYNVCRVWHLGNTFLVNYP